MNTRVLQDILDAGTVLPLSGAPWSKSNVPKFIGKQLYEYQLTISVLFSNLISIEQHAIKPLLFNCLGIQISPELEVPYVWIASQCRGYERGFQGRVREWVQD